MKQTLCFDMDGTFVDLYGVDNWLDYLMASDPLPYQEAKPLVNLSLFARLLNKAQADGHRIEIVSWTSKGGSAEYNEMVKETKIKWIETHLPSVHFDKINIVPYGTPKHEVAHGWLFDDEKRNRDNWNGIAFNETEMIEVLKCIA